MEDHDIKSIDKFVKHIQKCKHADKVGKITDNNLRQLLHEINATIDVAKFNLFKSSVYLDKIDNELTISTQNKIKKILSELNEISNDFIDFINNQDFPKSTK